MVNFPVGTPNQRRDRHEYSSAYMESLELRTMLAATLPVGFVESQIAAGLTSPTAMEFAPDGRLFITEQGGTVKVVKNGQLLPTPFATVDENSNGERGLLGVTFDPAFATNHYVYLYYTANATPANANPHNVLRRVTADPNNPDVALAGSEQILFEGPSIGTAIWHMGGAIHFGVDNKIYISVGDHQVPTNAQLLNNLMGKILRLNADGTIPTDNPFYNRADVTGVNKSIWAYGLRNPFTTVIQPGTGVMYINDVGEGSWEEVNVGAAGANYGWSATEGNFNQATYPNFTLPLYTYPHSDGVCVIGGGFYTNVTNQFPAQYQDQYFIADFGSGWVRTINPITHVVSPFATGLDFPTAMKISPDGSLWYLTRGQGTGGQPNTGELFQVRYTLTDPARITGQPTSQLISSGKPVTFTASASGTGTISYQWRRNGFDIPGANAASHTISSVQLSDSGVQFSVYVSNAYGSDTSNAATLTVTSDQGPTATITSPTAGTLYSGGQTITYAGTGTDVEDGNLPASAYTWSVDLHHDAHSHPFVAPVTGVTGGSFVIPTTGEVSPNVFYRINLTVRDSLGLTHSTFRDVQPIKATLTLTTNISGLQLSLDNQQSAPTPFSVLGVAGLQRTVSAPAMQTVGGVIYEFESWSDGGAVTHVIAFPGVNATITATYRAATGIYLSDLTPTGTPINGWGPYERDRSNGEQGAADGLTISLAGFTYAKGLGVHADSEQIYNLSRNYSRFRADIGIDDEVVNGGSVIFQVFADGTNIYTSPAMTGTSATVSLDLDVQNVNDLRLVVGANGSNANDHADWAAARLIPSAVVPPVAFSAKVNFQDATSTGFAGYVADTGLVFGSRGNGFSYGWDVDNTANARNRNLASSTDERYDTLNHLQKAGGGTRWEIAVPNGVYAIHVVSGDPGFTDHINNLNLEGALVTDPDGNDNFDEYNLIVPVTDGRLTVTAGSGAVNSKLSYIEIASTKIDPIIATPAAGTPNPTIGTTTVLSVLGIDDASEALLTYTWSLTGIPPALVTYSVNGTNAAKNTVATFTQPGTYNFLVTITDATGRSVTSSVAVVVQSNGSITGQVYEDRNSNGIIDAGDPTQNGVTVYLDTNNNSVLDGGESSVMTSGAGNYSFSGLVAGNYVVRQIVPTNYIAISSAGNVAVGFNAAVTGKNFGNFPIVLNGTAANDSYWVRSNGISDEILVGGILTYSILKSLLPGLTINGQSGDDTLILDYSAGDPMPAGGITFNGGANNDTLDVRGSGIADAFALNTTGIISHGSTNSNFSALESIKLSAGTYGAGTDLGAINLDITGATSRVNFTQTQNLSSLIVSTGAIVTSASTNMSVPALVIGGVTINNGKLIIAPNGNLSGVSKFNSLNLIGTGMLELYDNDLVIDYGNGPSVYASILSKIKSGLTLLGGDGISGVGSAEVDNQSIGGTVLAVVDDGDPNIAGGITSLSGFTIPNPTTSVLVKFTWFGDSNLDGLVAESDYALIDTGYTSGGLLSGWDFGDYDYSDTVDGSDYALIDTGFIAQNSIL